MSVLTDDVRGAGMPADVADLDESTLLQLSRDGDAEAFAELFRRHHAVAVRIAARASRTLDPEEVAAEAFARVWSALTRGKGPDQAFRPYLATAIRNVAMNLRRSDRDVATDPAQLPEPVGQPDETATAIAEGQVVCAAFGTLPERWKQALWATEVEGLHVADYARSIGISPNAASALCLRAREGLKAAWLQTHVHQRSGDPECQWVLDHLGAHARHRLPAGQRGRVEAHLADCPGCRRTLDRLAVIGRSLKVSVLFVGTGSSFLAIKAAFATSAGAGGAVLAVAPATGLAGPLLRSLANLGRRASGRAVAASGPGLVGVAAGALVATGVAVAAVLTASMVPSSAGVRAEQVLAAPVASPTASTSLAQPPSPRRPDAKKSRDAAVRTRTGSTANTTHRGSRHVASGGGRSTATPTPPATTPPVTPPVATPTPAPTPPTASPGRPTPEPTWPRRPLPGGPQTPPPDEPPQGVAASASAGRGRADHRATSSSDDRPVRAAASTLAGR